MIRNITRRVPLISGRLPSISFITSGTQRKYLLSWFRSRRKDYLLNHGIPWLTYDSVRFLREHLQPGIKVFEYGSGSSTLFWAQYKAHCISIEHDPAWYALLSQRLGINTNIDLRLVTADNISDESTITVRDLADPDRYWSEWESLKDRTFRNYVSQIDSFPNGYFDVVLVDGQARPACIKHAYTKVRAGGYLIVDNANETRYLARSSDYLKTFERHSFAGIAPIHGAMSQTDIYIAP